MESGGDNKSSTVDLRTGPATNLGELHQTPPVIEQQAHGNGSTNDKTHLEAHPSVLGNNLESHPSLSLSQNPFLDSTNNTHVAPAMSEKVHDQHESSPGNPFQQPTNTNSKATVDAFEFESWQSQPPATAPTNNVEAHHAISATEQGQQSMANSNVGATFSAASESSSQEPIHNSANAASNSKTDTNETPKLGLDSQLAAQSSDDDNPRSSMPKHGSQPSDVAGQNSASAAVVPGFSNYEFGTNNGSEIQNPPLQVMERPGDSSDISSTYNFPSHVFARNNTNAPVEWSTASNESLFSIYMGNMSFSSDLTCLGKSAELDIKAGELYSPELSPNHNALQSNQPQPLPQPPPNPTPVNNKFNDISQRTAELHEGEGSKATEAKAAETMREVIMETSRTTENKENNNNSKGDSSSFAHGAAHTDRTSTNSSHSHHSEEGSTKSFAFKPLTDANKSVSSKKGVGVEEKEKQKKQSEQEETPNAAPPQNPDPNASNNKWLSCFPCCTFCH